MKAETVYHYDAFSSIPNMGNPAEVVLDGADLTEKQMQEVAEKVGFNETAFVLKSENADLRIRFGCRNHRTTEAKSGGPNETGSSSLQENN
ncbi:hypothetical protein DNHGIG_28560 [Collibacillus ludicampi]|uniref:Uncharacterized protein n=1 Tax=Collibacillus ludicampi TaxID=2771369 RepID=A0AAV4LIS3_9BACL|nr:hypothetical protein DNHGIG_28560 [Collibacillus ludicampi]